MSKLSLDFAPGEVPININNKIPKVSFSQLQTFDRCAFKWDLGYNQNWTEKKVPSYFQVGNDVHEYMHIYYKNIILTSREHCITLILNQVTKKLQKVLASGDTDQATLIRRAANIVLTYVKQYAPVEDSDWDILDAEKFFEVQLVTPTGAPYILVVGIDLVTRSRSTQRISIWDHKSMNGKQHFWGHMQTMMDPQIPTYIIALRKIGVPVFNGIINQINTYDYKNPDQPLDNLFQREATFYTTAELDAYMNELGKAVDVLLKTQQAGEYRRSRRGDCYKCSFAEPCTLSMKGLDINDILNATYKQKVKR